MHVHMYVNFHMDVLRCTMYSKVWNDMDLGIER